jgi:hypothetical protein
MQQYKGGPLKPIGPTPRRYAADACCEFAGCDRPVKAGGLCSGHYMQRREGMQLRPLKQRAKGHVCVVDGCDRTRHGLGYCNAHYLQVLKGETPHAIRTPSGLSLSPATNGYVAARVYPDHPLYEYAKERPGPCRRGLYHRLVMSQALGRCLLPTETVHHIDGDRANNSLSNLEVRHGNHGQGQSIVCADCGSHNTRTIPLRR